jgi:hypothetical protein
MILPKQKRTIIVIRTKEGDGCYHNRRRRLLLSEQKRKIIIVTEEGD